MRRLMLGWALIGALSCDDAVEPGAADAGALDALVVDATPDAQPDAHPLDAEPDALADAALPDAALPDAGRCSAPLAAQPVGPLPQPLSAHRGVDAVEQPAWQALRAGLLADPEVHFVATYDHARAAFVVAGGPLEARSSFVFHRVDDATGSRFEVIEGAVADVFGSTDATRYGTYEALLAALTPTGQDLTGMGYAVDDPRIGVLREPEQAWPNPLPRIAQVFDGPDAPDAIGGVWPWTHGGTGSHGGLGLLQSRATFIVSGAGARRGVVIDGAAELVDAVPTALAALGADTTGGFGPDGRYEDGLYLLQQDGHVRWDALDPDACVRAKHVVLVLFDGLLATEINHLALDDSAEVQLPTFQALAREGTVFRHGAVVGFPSMSAPGHMTAGTGLRPGHHGLISNAFWGRAEQAVISPYALLQDPDLLTDSERLWALYNRFSIEGIETLADAVHRSMGPEATAAVINEITVAGADWSTVDHFFGATKALDRYQTADRLAMVQLRTMLARPDAPVPTTLQMSLVTTDAAGEGGGPHAPLLRETVLVEADRQLATLRQRYADRGVLEDTLFILVSDHGMELQAPGGTGQAAVIRTGVPTSYGRGGLIYLRTVAVEVAHDDVLRVTVRRHEDDAPVAGATVACEGCEAPAVTDAAGVAVLVPVAESGTVTVEAAGYFGPVVMAY